MNPNLFDAIFLLLYYIVCQSVVERCLSGVWVVSTHRKVSPSVNDKEAVPLKQWSIGGHKKVLMK